MAKKKTSRAQATARSKTRSRNGTKDRSRASRAEASAPFIGEGGELHQVADAQQPLLTTAQGMPIGDNQNSLKAGSRGPTLMEDFVLREKLFHFDHERIPERVVHARGYGAHGYFETYDALSDITRADLFQRKGQHTPAFVRFSTVVGSKGSFDLARDVRGFAVKLYTQEGNWDLVGNNIPVFFIQDAIKFPDLVHSIKEAPDRAFPQAQAAHDNFWDFISLMPESMHMIMWVMSDRAIPRSYRFMEGFGVHTFRLINAQNKSTFVKFHWKPKLGLQSVTWNEAVRINGADPDFHRRDLWNAIESGDYPEWELGLQLFDEDFAEAFEFDILDATKLIPEEQVPIRRVGRLVLDRLVDNFFAETEQVAFLTHNIVPGIDFTNDPLLQGRHFSYLDTQLKRLGSPNFTQLPINAPKCPFHHFLQDGHMAMRNPRGRVNYEPNSWQQEGTGPRESPERGFVSDPVQEHGPRERHRSETFADHYSQARLFFISQTPVEQNHLIGALVFELSKVKTTAIRTRLVAHLLNIDTDLAKRVADGLRLPDMPVPIEAERATRTDLPASPALSILRNGPNSFAGRKIGALITDGTDTALLEALQRAVKQAGATLTRVAPHVGGIRTENGTLIEADERLEDSPSALFDAVAVLASENGAERLMDHLPTQAFIADAHRHCKFIAYAPTALPLIEKACGSTDVMDDGWIALHKRRDSATFLERCREIRFWQREHRQDPS